MPDPPESLADVKNRSKSRARSSGAMPGPRSSTVQTTSLAVDGQRQTDRGALRRELDGVRQQVEQGLFEAPTVAVHPDRAVGQPEVEALFAGLEQARQRRAGLASQADAVEAPRLERQRPGAEAGEVEHVGHQALHALGAPRDPLQELCAGGLVGADTRIAEETDGRSDRGQRRPQLMGNGGQQVRPEPLQRLELGLDLGLPAQGARAYCWPSGVNT